MWSDGKRKWWLSHEGENGPKGLSTDGELPESFPAIRKAMEQSQLAAGGDAADVDYIFEIPLKVAQSLVGFKHDEECAHLLDKNFSVMSPTAPTESLLRLAFPKVTTLPSNAASPHAYPHLDRRNRAKPLAPTIPLKAAAALPRFSGKSHEPRSAPTIRCLRNAWTSFPYQNQPPP
jgi:hypothetical protein